MSRDPQTEPPKPLRAPMHALGGAARQLRIRQRSCDDREHSMVVAIIALGTARQERRHRQADQEERGQGIKVKDHSLTGNDLNLGTLGTVPNANHATNADNATHAGLADNIAAPDAFHEVGAPGELPFEGGGTNLGEVSPGISNATTESVGFYNDRWGVVHLKGLAKTVSSGSLAGLVSTCRRGYRPAPTRVLFFNVFCSPSGGGCATDAGSNSQQYTRRCWVSELVSPGSSLLASFSTGLL